MGKHKSKHIDLTDDDYYDEYYSDDHFEEDYEYDNTFDSLNRRNEKRGGPEGKATGNKSELTDLTKKNSASSDSNLIKKSDFTLSENLSKSSNTNSYTCVILGHVDSGKSTLMGHLLVDLGYIGEGVIRKYFKESADLGKGSFAYAWVFDDCEDERERGITMNVTAKNIKVKKDGNDLIITALDAPGHLEFIQNSFFATIFSNNAVVVIDASDHETGFIRGQTKEHISFALFSNVSNIVFALNKMDIVEWDRSIYDNIVHTIKECIKNELYDINNNTNLLFVPVSAFKGTNIYRNDAHCWYSGPALYEILSNISGGCDHKMIKNTRCRCLAETLNNNNKQTGCNVNLLLSACIFEILSVSSNEFKASIYLEYGTLKVGSKYILLPNQSSIKCKSILFDNKNHNVCVGPIFVSSVTFTSNVHPSVGSVIISSNHVNHASSKNSISLYYPLYITNKVKVKSIKQLNTNYFADNDIIWNVPGKSFMIYFHCESVPVILTRCKNNTYYFQSDIDFVSYLRCSCLDSSNMGKVIVRFFGMTAFIGEIIL